MNYKKKIFELEKEVDRLKSINSVYDKELQRLVKKLFDKSKTKND